MRKISNTIWIYMNGLKVARLARSSSGRLELRYVPEWIASPNSRPLSLSLPVVDMSYAGAVVEAYFDNLLPDSEPIKRRLQTRFRATSTTSFDLLWHIGRDCVGGIQLLPEESDEIDVKKIEGRRLGEGEIAEILANYKTWPLGMGEEDDFRISIAGAQEKTALLFHDGKWHVPHGTTPTTHILKLPIGRNERFDLSDSVENEWLCHLILKEYGVPVADSAIMTFEGTKALVVQRFDRRFSVDGSWIIRLPQEDMCQALAIPPALKYEADGGPGIQQVMEVLRGSSNREEDIATFMKAQFIFWLLAAIDGHGKNFSIFLHAGGRYSLTPIYDVISAHPLIRSGSLAGHRVKMAMAVGGKRPHYHWERIKYRHWLNTAKLSSFSEAKMEVIIEDLCERLDQVLEAVREKVGDEALEKVFSPIAEGMKAAREMVMKSRSEG